MKSSLEPLSAGAAAFVIGSCLTLMQLDVVSRRILTPDSLRTKRRLEQRHNLEQAIARQMELIQERILKTPVEILSEPLQIQDLVQTLTWNIKQQQQQQQRQQQQQSKLNQQEVILVGIATDTSIGTSFEEWYLHLILVDGTNYHTAVSSSSSSSNNNHTLFIGRRIQVPLVPFALQLANVFDDKVTSTAFCFIADASSGLGTHVLTKIAKTCDLCVIEESSWMTTLAYIAQQNLIATAKLERIVYSLCRLQAWIAREHVGPSKTILFTLPGQSSTAQLLPLLHRVFPCERHVFVYDGCVDSTLRGLAKNSLYSCKEEEMIHRTTRMPQSVTASVPISPLMNQTSVSQSLYVVSLSKLPATLAGIVEAWMSSVDTFLTLKTQQQQQQQTMLSKDKDTQTETKLSEEYLPFVCRLGILLGQIGRLGNGDKDLSELACINLLQYMTGSRSRPLPDTITSKAYSALHELQEQINTLEKAQATKISQWKRTYSIAIERCVFTHKNILIENKTLMDTVQPMKEWTLLAAKKVSGCSCCLPIGENDEDAGTTASRGNLLNETALDSSSFSTLSRKTSTATVRSNYVDGKTVFAFDPNRFNSF